MPDLRPYARTVRRSLLQREMVGGVPQVGLLLLFVLGIVFVYGLRLYIAIVPIALMFLVMRHLSKKDQWLIDIVMENVMQKDVLLP